MVKKYFPLILVFLLIPSLIFCAEIIVDNDDGSPDYTETGSWLTSGSSGYNGGTYRFADTDAPLATATWTPTVPTSDYYEVYVWYREGANRPTNAPYTINHATGSDNITVDQTTNGQAWFYIGTWYFNAGTSGSVVLSDDVASGTAIIADAVRFLTAAAVEEEFRGMWVSRFEWPNSDETTCKNSITQLMSTLAEHNFNAVLFQVRGQMDVLYPSPYEPWSDLLGGLGVDPGWDPLQYAIDRAHENGLEFHAYINTHVGWQSGSNSPPAHTTPEHPYWLHLDAAGGNDDWLIHDSGGNPVQWESSGYVWCAPGVPGFSAWIRKVVLHVVENYDVDGVHFDRIRTPANTYSYDPISMARMAGPGNPDSLGFHDWTRDQITRMLNNIYGEIMSVKPNVKVSCAPFGIYDRSRFPGYSGFTDAYDKWQQDAQHWAEVGVVDAIVPMIYWDIPDPAPNFDILIQDWVDYSYGRHIYGGMASYKYDSAELIEEINETRTSGGHGNVPFSLSSTSASKFDAYLAGPYSSPATPPVMSWKASPTTGVIIGTVVEEGTLDPVTDAWIQREGSSYTWLTDSEGFYAILNIPPGTYDITGEKTGVGDDDEPDVVITAGSVVTVDLVLSDGTAIDTWRQF